MLGKNDLVAMVTLPPPPSQRDLGWETSSRRQQTVAEVKERMTKGGAKRFRRPKAKPGELKVQWGKLPDDKPDICYVWGGEGASSHDGHLLHGMFSGFEHRKYGRIPAQHDGYLAELEARGYDLTTLKFSIRQKKRPVT